MQLVDDFKSNNIDDLNFVLVDNFMINVKSQQRVERVKIEILNNFFANFVIADIILKDQVLFFASHEATTLLKNSDKISHDSVMICWSIAHFMIQVHVCKCLNCRNERCREIQYAKMKDLLDQILRNVKWQKKIQRARWFNWQIKRMSKRYLE